MATPGNKKPATIPLLAQPGQPGWKARTQARWHANHPNAGRGITPAPSTPASQAMNMFHTTLAQIRKLQAPVDTSLISAPYETAKVGAGMAAQSLAQNALSTGQAAQDQYQAARTEAQQASAAAGAGAGAPITALNDPGSSQIALHTQANAAAAGGAAAAWEGLIENAKQQAVYKAQTDRANQDYQVTQSLASNIPTWQQNIEQQNFQEDTATKNYLLALGTRKDKQANEFRNYLLDKSKLDSTNAYQQGLLGLGQQRVDATNAANDARVAHWSAVEKRMNAAAKAKGFSSGDISNILKTLKGPASSSSKRKQGYTITRVMTDPSIGDVPNTQGTYFAAVPNPPQQPGWRQVGTGKAVAAATGGGGSQKFSWSRYKAAASLAKTMAAQRGVTLSDADVRGLLGPTPKTTGKKKKP